MFQVGKTYVSKMNGNKVKIVYTVLYQTPDDYAFVSYNVEERVAYCIIKGSVNFEEYREPKSETVYVHLCRNSSGNYVTFVDLSNVYINSFWTSVGYKKVTITEGEKLNG